MGEWKVKRKLESPANTIIWPKVPNRLYTCINKPCYSSENLVQKTNLIQTDLTIKVTEDIYCLPETAFSDNTCLKLQYARRNNLTKNISLNINTYMYTKGVSFINVYYEKPEAKN